MVRFQNISTADLVFRFLAAQQTQLAPSSHKWYAGYLLQFAKNCRALPADKITCAIVSKWIARYPDASQHNAARTIIRVCNWAEAERLLPASPLRGFRKPSPTRRQSSLTPPQYALCVKQSTGPLRDVVKFLYHTGCRPQELRTIESRWITGPKIIMPLAESKGHKKRRVIYLDSMAMGVALRLSSVNNHGPIFLNSHGDRWNKNSLRLAFQRLRRRTGLTALCAYQFRHAFITRLLERGVDVATVAAVAGNSPAMVLEVYNHVDANEIRLLSIVRRAPSF
jgi:integrase